ncbi:MAG: glycine cleavage system aminomethyltransferase GcvT [Bacilli bacterium]|jgi:aminomethyltransferase
MKKTVLYPEHVRLQAQIVPFADYLMPLQYSSIANEHDAVRNHVGIFDVSHMGEIMIQGPDSLALVNRLVTNLVNPGPLNKATYAIMCHEDGGAIDDLFVYPLDVEKYLLVVNASNIAKDEAWIRKQASGHRVDITNLSDDYGQIAVQGPASISVVSPLFKQAIAELKFMQYLIDEYEGRPVMVSRSGYTGEDGFELYADPDTIWKLWKHFVDSAKVTPCGLGCRDTLRFEGALSLYGHELSDTITPIEAGLKFACNFTKDFIGKSVLEKQWTEGAKRALVGIELLSRGIARADHEVAVEGKTIGHVTTGYLLPHHASGLALALIDKAYSQIGQAVDVVIRGQTIPARVRDNKFMEKKYKR